MAERVELELLCLPGDRVAAALHLRIAGTPVRSFASPLHGHQQLSSRSLDASAAHLAAAAIADEALKAAPGLTAEGCAAAAAAAPAAAQAGQQADLSSRPAGPSQAAPGHAGVDDLAVHAELSDTAAGPVSGPTVELEAAAAVGAAAAPASGTSSSSGPAHVQQQEEQQEQPPAAAPAAAAAGHDETDAPDGAAGAAGGGSGSAASLDAVMGMLQQLLATSGAALQQAPAPPEQAQALVAALQPQPPQPAPEPAPSAHSSGSAGGLASSSMLPSGSVEKLLALELEVVQLQQSLQIAQLEFETRTVQLHSLKQRADEADQRAQAADERAAGLAQQVQQLERQAADLRSQLGEAANKHVQELTLQAARLSAAAAKQQAAEEDSARLRQQLAAAQESLRSEQAQRASAVAAERGPLQERAAALQHENQQLRAHLASACSALKALGIPAPQVFSRAALALVGHAIPAQSPPLSPAVSGAAPVQQQPAVRQQLAQQQQQQVAAQQAQPAAVNQQAQQQQAQAQEQQAVCRPVAPPVPRLQLSSISLEALQAAASAQQEVEEVTAAAAGLPPVPPRDQQQGGCEAGMLHSAARAAAYARLRVAVGSPASALGHIASPHSVQNSTDMPLPPLSARVPVSPAAQQLLATARQWQLTARSAVADEEAEERIAAYRPQHAQQQWQQPQAGGGRPPSRTALGGGPVAKAALARVVHTARPHHHAQGGPAAGRSPVKQGRRTYSQVPAFTELKQAYQAVVSAEADSAAKWARSVFSSSSAVETDPRRVEPVMQGLLQLFRENGLPIPLQKCGPCQYKLGAAKLSVRLVNGRLMGRAGAGQQLDLFEWLGKQPVAPT
ncbi:hypothetical protein COHA_003412 [Chlorella ohadii]|uniref:Uncharacterized protein n=1 Tax=Chlorella ohadii TaxID=2649997 RepID=A0AAD5H7B0_9CHLO|nr:hypothetical protein COHA_003412 [Chlorella ohadii]